MANGAFVVWPPFPPAFAIETRPRPARCGYLGCWRVGQADRTLTLRAGNLHGIPSTAPPHSRRCFPTAPTAEPAVPPTHKIRLLADAPAINGLGLSARKRVNRRTVGWCNLSGSTPSELVESLLPRRSTAGRVGRAAIRSTGRGQRRHGSSPPRTGRCMSSWFAHRMWIDRRNLNRRIILAAQAHCDPRGQDGHEQQERPGAPPQGHTPHPSTGQHSRGCYCTGVEKQSPGVKPSAVHVSVRMWQITCR